MNRRDLQRLTRQRLRDARALLKANCPAGAYYLAGYAVECGLKACVAKQTRRHEFPELKRVKQSWTHNLRELISVAGLERDFNTRIQASRQFESNWGLVKDWEEAKRYDPFIDMRSAQDLYNHKTPRRSTDMDKATLVSSDIEKGKAVLDALDKAHLDIRLAFWRYFDEPSEWRLVLATPLVDRHGPLEVYRTIVQRLSKLPADKRIAIQFVTAVGLKNPLSLAVPPPAGKKWEPRSTGDTYVYRST